ncbi:MAG: histidine kinase, partial [Bacteroidota bacterium]
FLAYKLRIRQLMKVQHIRTRIASDLHDEVGGVLARISIQSELLSRNNEPGNQQNEQLHRIAENSKHAIGMMSDVLWSIDARSDTLQNMLDRMRDFATVLDEKNIACTFSIHTTDGGIQLASDKRQHIYLIFKEAITNMIKHSNATKASIELTVRSGVLILLIHDNGTISTPAKLPGQGLANMKMRAAKLHADLTINTNNGYGISLSCRI